MGAVCSYRPLKNARLEQLETEAACPQQTDRRQQIVEAKKEHQTYDIPAAAKFTRIGSMQSVTGL
ncbi:MAG: hypothetical protein K2N01_00660 [Lachnospiraceae bacterium]|nr:hypothetical protein [Lachnospiraceae bacterium]